MSVNKSSSMSEKIQYVRDKYNKLRTQAIKRSEKDGVPYEFEEYCNLDKSSDSDIAAFIKRTEDRETKISKRTSEERILNDVASEALYQLTKRQAKNLMKHFEEQNIKGYSYKDLRMYGFDIAEAHGTALKKTKTQEESNHWYEYLFGSD